MIAGRKIQLDTANHSHGGGRAGGGTRDRKNPNRTSFDRRGGGGGGSDKPWERGVEAGSTGVGNDTIDGSKFRGGRYGNKDNRGNHHREHTNRRASDSDAVQSHSRPSLKLAPRSKPKENENGMGGSHSDIFGGAKPRDESTWEQRRKSYTEGGRDRVNNNNKESGSAQQERRPSKQSGGRGSGRGGGAQGGGHGGVHGAAQGGGHGGVHGAAQGRGRGGGGGHGGRGRGESNKHDHKDRKNAKQKNTPPVQAPEEKAAAAAAAAPAQPAPAADKAAPKQVNNKFALLMDSDSE